MVRKAAAPVPEPSSEPPSAAGQQAEGPGSQPVKEITVWLPGDRVVRTERTLERLEKMKRSTKSGASVDAPRLDDSLSKDDVRDANWLPEGQNTKIFIGNADTLELEYSIVVEHVKEPKPGFFASIGNAFVNTYPALAWYKRHSVPLKQIDGFVEGRDIPPTTINLGIHATPLSDGLKVTATKNSLSPAGKTCLGPDGPAGMATALMDQEVWRLMLEVAQFQERLVDLIRRCAKGELPQVSKLLLALNINYNAATQPHLDMNNLLGTISTLLTLIVGNVSGGELVLLEPDPWIVIPTRNGTLVLAPFEKFWHCNLQLMCKDGGARIAVLGYIVIQMMEQMTKSDPLSGLELDMTDREFVERFKTGEHFKSIIKKSSTPSSLFRLSGKDVLELAVPMWSATAEAVQILAKGDPLPAPTKQSKNLSWWCHGGFGPGEVEGEIIKFCRSHLAGFKIPARIQLEMELPKTATGKIRKNILRDQEWKKVGGRRIN